MMHGSARDGWRRRDSIYAILNEDSHVEVNEVRRRPNRTAPDAVGEEEGDVCDKWVKIREI